MVRRSTITSKGQTTIPKEIRDAMDLKEGDGLVYTIEEDRIIARPVKGTLLDAYGSVKPVQRPEDFKRLRDRAKKQRSARQVSKK